MKTLLASFVLIVIFAAGCQRSLVDGKNRITQLTSNPSPSATPTPEKTPPAEQREVKKVSETSRFEAIPENYRRFDFRNFSYPYRFRYEKKNKISILLKDGEYRYDIDDDRGWFDFLNVYFFDLTGDGEKEAIIALNHVSCGMSCDGGAYLFYVYELQNDRLKLIWQEETGGRAYGCGLKRFSAESKKITVELFGDCRAEKRTSDSMRKFKTSGATIKTFEYDGKNFIARSDRFSPSTEMDVQNYNPEFSFNERKDK